MISLKDKVVGSYYGMALGNAMGLSAKSLKPETIQQLFGSMDGFKDVIPYIENYDSNNEIRFTKHISEDDDWDKLKETVLIVK